MKLKIEDERKFLVKKMPRSYLEEGGKEITQWYICIDPPVRVRVENFDDCFLTIKIKKEPGKNYELEEVISKRTLSVLAGARKNNKIRKIRHNVGILELDVFLAQLEGLVILEFERKLKKDVFKMPIGFLAEEVTGDVRFENHNLISLDKIPEEWRCEIVAIGASQSINP